MITINTERAFKNAENLKHRTSSHQLLVDSLILILKPTRNDWKRKLLFVGLEIFAAIIISVQVNTISMAKEIFSLLITVIISLIAIVFTGYAFFQALINDKLLVALLSVESEENNRNTGSLLNSNKYFAEVMTLQIFCLMLDLIAVTAMTIMPEDWYLFDNNTCNVVFSCILILCTFYCNVECIWEMKSFIFNVFQLFNLHAYSRIQKIKESNKKEI